MSNKQRKVAVCQGTGCMSGGAEQIYSSLETEIAKLNLGESIQLKHTGCHGFCQRGPLVVVEPEGIFYSKVEPDDIPEIAEIQREFHVLLGQQDRQSNFIQVFDRFSKGPHKGGGQSFRRFVEEQELGVSHQCSPDSEHLLLAAAEKSPRSSIHAPEGGKEPIDPLCIPIIVLLPFSCSNFKVLPNGEIGKDPSIIRDIANAHSNEPERLLTCNILVLKRDVSCFRRRQPHDTFQGRRLAGAVSSQETDDLS